MVDLYRLIIKTIDGQEHIISNLKEQEADRMLEDIGIFDWVTLVTDSDIITGKIKVANIVSIYKRSSGYIDEES